MECQCPANYFRSHNQEEIVMIKVLIKILLLMIPVAWVTHIIHCLITAKYLLLIAGALIFPVGVIHGVGIWFGVSW